MKASFCAACNVFNTAQSRFFWFQLLFIPFGMKIPHQTFGEPQIYPSLQYQSKSHRYSNKPHPFREFVSLPLPLACLQCRIRRKVPLNSIRDFLLKWRNASAYIMRKIICMWLLKKKIPFQVLNDFIGRKGTLKIKTLIEIWICALLTPFVRHY